MNKLILSCLSIFALCNTGYSQTYIYDKNLRVSQQVLLESNVIYQSKIYSTDEIITEFMANEIRASKLFTSKPFLIKGRIAKIFNKDKANYIALDVSDDETATNYLYVNLVNINNKPYIFDKVEKYSVGDWINIFSSGFMKHPGFSYEYLFFGVIFHTKELLAKKNYLVKVTNLPEKITIRYENDESERAQKFSDVSNGKSYAKFFNIGPFTTLVAKFIAEDGTVLKEKNLKAKINCISTFDYNKL